MPRRPASQTYQYKPQDDPIKLANQNGITPQQLFSANPGGTPFSIGQTIKIPTYIQPTPQNATAKPPLQPTGSFFSGGTNVASYYNNNIMALNTQPTTAPTIAPSTGAQTVVTNDWRNGLTPAPAGNTDFNQTMAAQYNAQNNIPFLQQKRWDPQKERYITVGQWLRQSQSRNRRGERHGSRAQEPAQAEADYTLANAIINFNVSAG